jgi:hypothetical protein
MAIRPFVEPWPLFQFLNHIVPRTQSVELLGRGISPSQGRYLQTKNTNTEKTGTDIHALSGIRTHDPSVRASELFHAFHKKGKFVPALNKLSTTS